MIRFVKNYINELGVLNRQLQYQSTYDGAIRGLVVLIGIPVIAILIGILALVNLLSK